MLILGAFFQIRNRTDIRFLSGGSIFFLKSFELDGRRHCLIKKHIYQYLLNIMPMVTGDSVGIKESINCIKIFLHLSMNTYQRTQMILLAYYNTYFEHKEL